MVYEAPHDTCAAHSPSGSAALCHVGQYARAHEDAEVLCRLMPSPQARMRLNAIKKYMATTGPTAFPPTRYAATGHEGAHITLLQVVTPSVFKQW